MFIFIFKRRGTISSSRSHDLIVIVNFHLRGYVATCDEATMCFNANESQLLILGVIKIKIKSSRWTLVDKWTRLECLMKIEQQTLSDASSSHVTW